MDETGAVSDAIFLAFFMVLAIPVMAAAFVWFAHRRRVRKEAAKAARGGAPAPAHGHAAHQEPATAARRVEVVDDPRDPARHRHGT